jgi:hypothetical protein
MNKYKLSKQQKSLLTYAKKWLMPDDFIKSSFENKESLIECRQIPGCDLRLFLVIDNKCVAMFTFYDNTQKWVREDEFIEECF